MDPVAGSYTSATRHGPSGTSIGRSRVPSPSTAVVGGNSVSPDESPLRDPRRRPRCPRRRARRLRTEDPADEAVAEPDPAEPDPDPDPESSDPDPEDDASPDAEDAP
jgi:hypothetical protein